MYGERYGYIIEIKEVFREYDGEYTCRAHFFIERVKGWRRSAILDVWEDFYFIP